MAIENRKQTRVTLKKDVLINGSINVHGLDLSIGGLYVHTGRQFTEGEIVSIALPLNARYLNMRARIQHVQKSVGMGLQFVGMTSEQESVLQDFIDSTEEAFAPPQRKTILLVDDQDSSRRMNKSRLILDGFSVVETHDGAEAVGMLERERVDLIVLDLYMEPLDGFQVLSIIRSNPAWKRIPVLVLSSRGTTDEIQRAMAAGANEFLIKMMTPPVKLSQKVKAYLPDEEEE